MARGEIPTCVLCLLAQVVNVPFMGIRGIAALTIVLAGAMGFSAPSVNATGVSPSPGCTRLNDSSFDGTYDDGNMSLRSYPMTFGETVTIRVSNASAGVTDAYLEVYDAPTVIYSVQTSPPGELVFVLTADLGGINNSMSWGLFPYNVSYTATWDVECIPYTAPASGSEESFPEHLQQVGRNSDGGCADISPDAVEWGQDIIGGWGLSWAQWANGGRGGPVCTRTIYYDSGRHVWATRT